jgi:hypothetical protein
MEQNSSKAPYPDRRAKHRIQCNYPAMVKGRDAFGKNFSEQGKVVNLSSSGILLLVPRSIENNTEVNVKIAFPTGSLEWGSSNLATKGVVVRNEIHTEEMVGIAVRFHGYRFT